MNVLLDRLRDVPAALASPSPRTAAITAAAVSAVATAAALSAIEAWRKHLKRSQLRRALSASPPSAAASNSAALLHLQLPEHALDSLDAAATEEWDLLADSNNGASQHAPSPPPPPPQRANSSTIDPALVREQLARHYVFLGEAGMARVRAARVVVVGVGGVGSHAAHMLARAGVGRVRVIDFDMVTLSSLNRHAVATYADVGLPKVDAMARALGAAAPGCVVEPVRRMFERGLEAKLLLFSGDDDSEEKPDFVLDCIDHLPTKAALLTFCHARGIAVVSSMGSGAKADPTKVRVADISETTEDPLARAVRALLRREHGIETGVTVVYSTERATPGLGLIAPGGDQEPEAGTSTDMAEFAPLPTFRASILPVLGPLPALFGNALAAYVLTTLAQWPSPSAPLATSRSREPAKMARELAKDAVTVLTTTSPIMRVSSRDAAMVVDDLFGHRSAVSGRVEQKLALAVWRVRAARRAGGVIEPWNVVPMTKDEVARHYAAELAAVAAESAEDDTWLAEVYPDSRVRERVERGLAVAKRWALEMRDPAAC
ncbi:hypothetical protein BC828DRAFT_375256 [Blastocladiella britannica]|nr:hypothetical protein BC828DRAFT_375256 [Blastocladiella britannica]